MLQQLWNILFPVSSLRGEDGVWVSPHENRLLRQGLPERIGKRMLCELGCQFLDTVVAGDRYARCVELRRALHLLKYRRSRAYVQQLLPLLLRASALLELRGDTVLCPVPLHWTRRFLRGFNQAQLLCAQLSLALGVQAMPLLRRTRSTGSQARRTDRRERRAAMEGAFALACPQHELPERRVVLVDDIFTSGATLDACAKTLKQAGVQRVEALVLARG